MASFVDFFISSGIFKDFEKSFVDPVGIYPIIEFFFDFYRPDTTSSKVTKISS